jgi:hypothetical protein
MTTVLRAISSFVGCRRDQRGQSLVETALIAPVLLLVLVGLVEIGMLGNNYLTVLDAGREGARFAASGDPAFRDLNTDCGTTLDYYIQIACLVDQSIAPLTLDSQNDDVVVSVFSVADGQVVARLPAEAGENGWSRYGNHTSEFLSSDIQAQMRPGDPSTGLVLVEVFYSHHQILAIPFLTAFIPDPITIQPYTMMPVSAAEPMPTP